MSHLIFWTLAFVTLVTAQFDGLPRMNGGNGFAAPLPTLPTNALGDVIGEGPVLIDPAPVVETQNDHIAHVNKMVEKVMQDVRATQPEPVPNQQ
ncbi:unnamed protein product [Caenorhabditis auriculariae]|uniref:Secreted protein n=1 Tax=Caenorhabditis auriculariae TaxID=2777116 RepID=A0A8S1H4Q5_9PELO|nr:unnamed protein product [Caenorhabditis auriculariae]